MKEETIVVKRGTMRRKRLFVRKEREKRIGRKGSID